MHNNAIEIVSVVGCIGDMKERKQKLRGQCGIGCVVWCTYMSYVSAYTYNSWLSGDKHQNNATTTVAVSDPLSNRHHIIRKALDELVRLFLCM